MVDDQYGDAALRYEDPVASDPGGLGDEGGASLDASAPAADPASRRGRLRTLLPWVLVVLAVAVAVASTWRWQQLAAVERSREDVAAATSRFVTTLTTWDASAGMTETRDELRERGTEGFARDVDELFGTTEDLRGLADLGATSSGEVRDVYVQSLGGDRAEALAVVVQQVTTDTVEIPEVHLRYASVVLRHLDGRWLVDDLELLIDTSPAATAGPAPGTGGGASEPAEDEDEQEREG